MREKVFDPIPPEAVVPLAFDFAAVLGSASIATVESVSIAATQGLDASASSRLHGTATISGTKVVQWIKNPVLGERYKIVCHIKMSDSREWSITAWVPVEAV